MSATPAKSDPAPSYDLNEERFSLREMLRDVQQERLTGAFGHEKLRRAEIRKIVVAKPRKRRAD